MHIYPMDHTKLFDKLLGIIAWSHRKDCQEGYPEYNYCIMKVTII
ncbi:hypothetical protein [Candidatus Erwinia haradaeae]|nr:hypothetical protein [Candidatus Erwinia haradaeae]